jgi:hypothetical protein
MTLDLFNFNIKAITMKYILVAVMFYGWLNGVDTDHSAPIALDGKWVDINAKTDTLTFKHMGNSDYMILGRGIVNNFGSPRPKAGSGPYHYKLSKADVISLRWSLSSDSNYKDYFFKVSDDTITIENFFDAPRRGVMLTFKRIE